MTETRNPRKRNRAKEGSTNKTTETPPAKKRRLSTENKKARSKDLTKWTVKDLKRYLKQNGTTFQMNKDKAYYIRLATRIGAQENKQNETNQDPNPSKTANRSLSQNHASQNQTLSTFDNANSSNSDSSNSPNFSIPRRSTPPLPSSLLHTPLNNDNVSEEEVDAHVDDDEDQNQNQDESQRPTALDASRRNDNTGAGFIRTPQSAKSRTLLQQVTPSNDARINPESNANIAAFKGPFQDLPSFTSFKRNLCDIEQIFSGGVRGTKRIRSKNSKYFTFLCIAVGLILMTMCIPYAVTLFVTAPFCDTNADSMSGTYSVFYGLIPLENRIECASCPFNATCDGNGNAQCAEGYRLDEYQASCLPLDDETALVASRMAHRAKIKLGKQLGDYECSWRDPSVQKGMSEAELKYCISYIAREYHRNNKGDAGADGDKEDSVNTNNSAVESLSDQHPIRSIEEGAEDDGSLCNEESLLSDEIMKETTRMEDESELLFVDESWEYARDIILPNAYATSVQISLNDSAYSFHAFREIPSSMKCKMVLLYRYYVYEHSSECVIQLGFVGIAAVALMVITYLRKTSNDSDNNEAIMAANFVLHKLSQQQTLHFSIEQFKHYTMRHQNISLKTWDKTVKYVNESSQIAKITEEIDGTRRMCWKWKSPVPFVPL